MQALLGNNCGQLRRQSNFCFKDYGMKRKMKESVSNRFFAFSVLLLLAFLFPPLIMRVSPPSRIRRHELGACNYSSGNWAFDASRMPLYASDCPFHRTAWNCGKNRRPEAERMSQWAWVPTSNCSAFSRVEPHSLLKTMRGMRVGFIGDSLNENFMVSLACTLSAADGSARKWKRRRAWRGAQFPAFDVTVGYHRAVLLAKHVAGLRVDVDVPADDWAKVTDFYDVLIFNTGHWWGYDKFPIESPLVFYKEGQPLWPPLSLREGLAAVLKSMLDFIDDRVPAKVLKVWRLQSPRHFQGGDWNQNGSCSTSMLLNKTQVEEWFDPAKNGGVNSEEREVNQVIRAALRGRQKYVVLDVATMSEFRADAHPSRWLGSQDAHLVWGQDCLHWCLPGVPDVWVDMLAAHVVEHIEAAHSTLVEDDLDRDLICNFTRGGMLGWKQSVSVLREVLKTKYFHCQVNKNIEN